MCINNVSRSEKHKLFPDVTDNFVRGNLEEVEANSLAEGSAFSNQSNVTDLNVEGGRTVDGDVFVSFFISVVFGDIVKVISSDDDGSLHFVADDDSLENLASDGDSAGEGAFLIDVVSLDSLLGSFEVEANIFVVPDSATGLLANQFLAVEEN